MKKLLLFFITIYLTSISMGASDLYSFSTSREQTRFETLLKQFRCLVCQNQTLADSNAPLAADLRQDIYIQLLQGKSDEEVIHYLVARYSQYVLYRPPFNIKTIGLWLSPFLILFIGLSMLFYILKTKSRE